MPVGTIDTEHYERSDLKSLPAVGDEECGYVMLRPLPYNMIIIRQDKALRMRMIQQKQKRNQPAPDQQVIDLEQMSDWTTEFDFLYCIGDHNITDIEGRKLDFTTSGNLRMALKSLNPKVGIEIQSLIDGLNQTEDDETIDDFLRRRELSSVTEPGSSPMGSTEQ